MKHSIVLKFIAIVLATCALTVALGSVFGVVLLAEMGLYSTDYDSWQASFYAEKADSLARSLAESYAARSLSGFTKEELLYFGWGNSWQNIGIWADLEVTDWWYTISQDNQVLESNCDISFDDSEGYSFTSRVEYPVKVSIHDSWVNSYSFFDGNGQNRMLYVNYDVSPEYTVTVWFGENSIRNYNGVSLAVYDALLQYRYPLIATLGGSLLLAAVCLVYLCYAAGKRRSDDTPAPGGLNRLPLDLYGVATFFACYGAAFVVVEIVEEFMYYGTGINWGWLTLGVLVVFAAALVVTGFLMALAAQWKVRALYIWHRSLVGWCLVRLWRGIRYVVSMLCKLYALLPLVWQYLLIAVGMAAVPLLFGFFCLISHDFGRFFWMLLFLGSLAADVGLVCYGAYAYGTLLKGAGKMAAGELYGKIDTAHLRGSYKACAENLNALADVAVVAAKNQTRSDRMKTELITNVSHDIKTPLTSIINYIDLLQKTDDPKETAEYLAVLDRQSQRLKKLIDDLMEMSKATTGNLSVEITPVDAVEAVNQALGEFSDKLAGRELMVVFRPPEGPMPIRADGRLTWRVLSNLLSNTVKYALPGTRVYVDLQRLEGRVLVSIKNISKEPLNVSADELTERFVRGDTSRNTEGSGLGLNIAKSLMELQKGHLQLLVDGDLFKVTLTFQTEG